MKKFWSKRKKWQKITLSVILLFVLIFAGGSGYLFYKLQHTAEAIYEPLPPSEMRIKVHSLKPASDTLPEPPSIKSGDPFTLLIMGVDERKNDQGRSDSLILAIINPNTPASTLISIPRDTLTSIVGRDKEDKINHAYAFGGVPMTVATVEELLQIPIDHYIKTNMKGFEEIIDALGGVDLNNKMTFSLDGFQFDKGPLHLSGEQALAYVRMRKADPNGDFGRMGRQQEVLTSLSQKALSVEGALQWVGVIDKISANVKTSIPSSEWTKLLRKYSKAVTKLEKESMKGSGVRKNGIYYWELAQGERERMHNLILEKMGLESSTSVAGR